jgi:hypothetical protein
VLSAALETHDEVNLAEQLAPYWNVDVSTILTGRYTTFTWGGRCGFDRTWALVF